MSVSAAPVPPAALALQMERRLQALRSARPELADAVDLQSALLRTQLSEVRPPHVESFTLPRERVTQKVRDGVPMLHGEPAFVDVPYAADLLGRLVNVLSARNDAETAARLGPLIDAATDGRLDLRQLIEEAFVRHADHLWEIALRADVDGDLLQALSGLSVAPLLRAYAEKLLPLVDAADDASPRSARWSAGYCPIDGAWPLLAELRGVEQQRYLRCSACGIGWPARRLVCAFCANDDFRGLTYFQVKGEARFKVEVCGRCNGYLKLANAFDPAPPALVALDDLGSVHLDLAAIERGHARPAGGGFRLELSMREQGWSEELADLD